jgi:hypothetical protein
MRKTLITSSVFFALFIYGLFLSQYHFSIVKDELETKNAPGLYDYRGTTHVHSDHGLGSGTYAEVIDAAQETHQDFLFFTDLNPFQRDLSPSGYHRQTLVAVAAQYSYLDSRVLLYDVINRHPVETLGQAQVLLVDLLSQSGPDADHDLIVLAHPFKRGYEWSGNYPTGLDGIEVINLKSVWQRAWASSKASFIWSLFMYPFNSQLALVRLYEEPQDEIQLWDRLNAQRKTWGFVGSDASAKTGAPDNLAIKFPSYQVSFGLVSNHVLLRSELTGEYERDRRKIFDALNQGQFYMALDILGNTKGFNTYLLDGDKTFPMGSQVKYAPGLKISAHLPQKPQVPFEVVFLKDGERIMSSDSADTELDIHAPGVYRVQVRVIPTLPLPDGRRWISWIYSNPFFVR